MTKGIITGDPLSRIQYQTIGHVVSSTVRGLDRSVVDNRWIMASLFAKVLVDRKKRGLWVTAKPGVSGPIPMGWPVLRLTGKSDWDYDSIIAGSIIEHNPELLVLDFRRCGPYIPIDEVARILRERGIDYLLITSDRSLCYLREALGAPKKSYPAVISYPAVSAPGSRLQIGTFKGTDDRVAYAHLVGKWNACAIRRANNIIDLSGRFWLHKEHRWILTGSEISADSIADVLKNGPPLSRYGTERKRIKRYNPFNKPDYTRVLRSEEDIKWLTNNKRQNHLVVSMDKLGQDLGLLEKFLTMASRKVIFSFLATPPMELLGVFAWRQIRSRLRMCVRVGWGIEDILFFRWRRMARTVEGAADLIARMREVKNVQNDVESDP